MNEITITGSTGVIGRRAVRELIAAGHRVTGVTRSASGRDRLESLGARAVEADVFDDVSLRRAFDGADAVVNLLTHVPSADRMGDRSAWAENDRVRTEASAAIAGAAQTVGVRRLVQESIAFVYDDGGRVPAARKPLHGRARVARAWAALSKSVYEPIEIKLNGELGLVLPSGDGHRAALAFVVSHGRITRIDAVRNPEKLRRL